MTQSEGDRILATLGGDFIKKGLDREHVALRAERAQRRRADRHREQAVAFDRPGRKIIERNGIAIATAAVGLRRIGRDRAREWISNLGSCEQRRLCRPAW